MVSVRAIDAMKTWFEVRAPRKDSEHTTRAYERDLSSVLAVIARQLGKPEGEIEVLDLAPLPVMRRAFGEWARSRSPRSVRRGHSTWSGFFEFLVSEELVPGSPMPGVGKPKLPRAQPKPFSVDDSSRILRAVGAGTVPRRDPWPELERAIVITDLATGLRTAELLGLNIGDVNRSPGNEGMRVLGKGGRERSVPVERVLLDDVIAPYLATRRARFPERARQRGVDERASAWDWWPPDSPLFVGRDGERLGRGALQYMIELVYRAAGVEATRAQGALTHALRHTAATRIAESGRTVVELMQLFGWASLSTPQAYIDATAREVRSAARANPVYAHLEGAAPPAAD